MHTPAGTAHVYRWSELPLDHPMPMLSRRRIIGEKMMISEVRLDRGCVVPSHSHANEQLAIVISGSLRFGLGMPGGQAGEEPCRVLDVHAGEVLHLPPFTPHSAEALEDSLVLDLFSPPSAVTGIDRA